MQKRNLTKEKIIQVAFSLSDEIGLNKVTFQKIAERLDIKYPSLYNHFSNMEDLKEGMTIYLFNDLNSKLMKRLIGKSGDEAVLEFALAYKDFAFKNRTAYGLFMSIPRTNNEKAQLLAKETTGILRQILSFYTSDEIEVIHKTRELRSIIHGFISMVFAGYFHGEIDPEESFSVMINDFILTVRRK